jgi:hypothetical protein
MPETANPDEISWTVTGEGAGGLAAAISSQYRRKDGFFESSSIVVATQELSSRDPTCNTAYITTARSAFDTTADRFLLTALELRNRIEEFVAGKGTIDGPSIDDLNNLIC